MNSTLALISVLGLGLGLETSGLGLGLGLEIPGLVNIPAARPLQTRPQTGPITIHCGAKLSAHCKYNIDIIDDRSLHYKFSLPDEVI